VFFTLEDERARIKGSMDPLGSITLWVPFGRRLIANLTTVSGSVRGFTVLLLGRYFAARLIDEGKAGVEDALKLFLHFEQMAGFARVKAHNASDVRGVERIRAALRESPKGAPIGPQILSDQKNYGLWGLFSVSGRVSGLLPAGPVGLTPHAWEFVEAEYLPRLRTVRSELNSLLKAGGTLRFRKGLYQALATVLSKQVTESERVFYAQTLRDAELVGEDALPAGLQAQFAALMREEELLETWLGRREVVQLAEAAARKGQESLSLRLQEMIDLEALLAPAEALFKNLLARDGWQMTQVVDHVESCWDEIPGLDPKRWEGILPRVTQHAGKDIALCMDRTHAAFRSRDYPEAVRALVDWNGFVMKRRGGAPWVRFEGSKLDVRFRDDEAPLPDSEKLPNLWKNAYFLNSLREVTRQLEA
jgi:hypothetical protein